MNKRKFKHDIKDSFKKLKEFVKSEKFIAGLIFGFSALLCVLIVSSCINVNTKKASAQTLVDDSIENISYDDISLTSSEVDSFETINDIFSKGENIIQEFPISMLPTYLPLEEAYRIYIPAMSQIMVKFVYNTWYQGYVAYAFPKLSYNTYTELYSYSYDVYKPIVDFSATGDVETINGLTYFNLNFIDTVYSYFDFDTNSIKSCAIRFWSMFETQRGNLFDLNTVSGESFPSGWGGIVLTRNYYSIDEVYGTYTPDYFPALEWSPNRFETYFYSLGSRDLNFYLKLDGYDANNTTFPAIYNVEYLRPCLLQYNTNTQSLESSYYFFANSRIMLSEGVQEFSFETLSFLGDSLTDTNASYTAGFNAGVEEGFDNGYDAGHKDGEVKGYDDGYNKGYTSGQIDGYDKGYYEGDIDGYENGYAIGESEGYSDGYNEGYTLGQSNGYNEGYADGLEDNSGGGTYAEGYRDGFAEGEKQANDDLYNLGYSDGYEQGNIDGFDDGFGEGYADGLNHSYDVGYQDGYNRGYDVGYDNGLDDADGGFNLFRGLVKSIDTLFTTPIAGENITLGLLLTTGLGLTLLIILLKTFFGG